MATWRTVLRKAVKVLLRPTTVLELVLVALSIASLEAEHGRERAI
jgi:hypothetical protein